jgi:zinc and cadmium transporter
MNAFFLSPAPQLAVYSSLVFAASLSGGWLLLALRPTHARLQMAGSFVAGLMLSMTLLHFIPHAIHESGSVAGVVRCVLAGFLAMFFLQRFFPHHHHDVADGAPEQAITRTRPEATLAERSAGQLSWVATTIGMIMHSLLGGIALAAAVQTDGGDFAGWLGMATALAIILHKPFDAMAVATLMTANGCSRRARHSINALFAFVTPAGAWLFYLGSNQFALGSPAVLSSALAFCAGTFLCIAGVEILPEVQYHSHDRIKLSLALLAGIAVPVVVG